MDIRWFGALIVIASCGGFGFSVAANYKKRERILFQMNKLIQNLQSELHYKLTPLPDLMISAVKEIDGPLRQIITDLSAELNRRSSPDVMSCMRAALAKNKMESGIIRMILLELASTLGRYDFEGQLKGLNYVQLLCTSKLDEIAKERDGRIRCYQTLGMCAGAAIVILFA